MKIVKTKGKNFLPVAFAADLLRDVEEGLVDRLDQILETGGDERCLNVAGASVDDERSDSE